jgi:hypothetical protein
VTARRLLTAVAAALLVVTMGCGSDGEGNPRRDDYEQDSPTTGQLPPSTGVPDESTTSQVEPGDGSLGDERTNTSIPGAEPGRPQLDGEPTQEPAG